MCNWRIFYIDKCNEMKVRIFKILLMIINSHISVYLKVFICIFSADGNEYASVDDPAILKMNSERDHYNGVDNGVYLVAGDTKGKTRVPKLPYRPNPKESEYLTAGDQMEEKGCDDDAFVNSDTSPSLLLEIPRRTEDSDITQYLTCSTENEREKQRNVDWWSNA